MTEDQKQRKRASSLKYYYAHKRRVRAANKKWYNSLSEEEKRIFIKGRKRRAKAWRSKNPSGRKDGLKRDRNGERFGITPKQYGEKKQKQGDLCGLCKRPMGGKATLDHNHKTKELREFIHSNCNLAIGLLEDSPELCRLAAKYLKRHAGD